MKKSMRRKGIITVKGAFIIDSKVRISVTLLFVFFMIKLKTSKAVALIKLLKIKELRTSNLNKVITIGVRTMKLNAKKMKNSFEEMKEKVSNSLNLSLEAPSKIIRARANKAVMLMKELGSMEMLK